MKIQALFLSILFFSSSSDAAISLHVENDTQATQDIAVATKALKFDGIWVSVTPVESSSTIFISTSNGLFYVNGKQPNQLNANWRQIGLFEKSKGRLFVSGPLVTPGNPDAILESVFTYSNNELIESWKIIGESGVVMTGETTFKRFVPMTQKVEK